MYAVYGCSPIGDFLSLRCFRVRADGASTGTRPGPHIQHQRPRRRCTSLQRAAIFGGWDDRVVPTDRRRRLHHVKGNIFRDSQGKIYRERHHFAGANVDPKLTLHEFSILDPVNLTRTTCETATRHCVITRYRPQFSTAIVAAGIFDNGKRMLVRTSLGNNDMEGLPVVGTLETTTLAAGTIGNDRTVTQSREFWYSADLKTNISITRKDPREGTQAVHLTLLSRDEPDPSVFAVPAGYTVEDTRSPTRASN
jgi:hypothetical protein